MASIAAVATQGPPTAKGMRAAEAILEAALRCLARDGYAASSVQRIADEAGVQKRMVHYYFDSREQLFDEIVRRVGDRLLAQVEEAIEGLEEPNDIASAGFERLWSGITSDRGLLVAYFGLAAESVTDPRLRKTIAYINDGYRRLIDRLIADAEGHGRTLRMDRESVTVLIIAGIHGLTLEWLERGDTPALRKAIADYQRWVATLATA